jgi:putative inorganic carbon (HCO3(-)) transporter
VSATGTLSRSGQWLRSHRVDLIVVTGAIAVAAYSGLMSVNGNKASWVLPMTAVAAVIFGILALTEFRAFIFVVLLIRPAIDLVKLSGASAGNTTTNGIAQRGLDPSSIVAALVLLAGILWLIAQYRAHGPAPRLSLRWAMLAFAAASFLSALSSERPTTSLLEALRISAVIVMFLVLVQLLVDEATTRLMLTASFASMIFPLAYTLLGFLVGGPASEVKGSFTRITGPFAQSNTFGRYLMLMIVMGAALLPYLDRRRQAAMAVLLSLSGVFLLLTYTRTAIIGCVIGLVVVGLIQSKKLIIAIGVLGVVSLAAVPVLLSRFVSLTTANTGTGPTGNSLLWRIGYWLQVVELANRNLITGIGLDMTQYNTSAEKQPHNDFLRAYVETGIVGFVAYVWLLASLVRTSWSAVRLSVPKTLDRGIAAGALGCSVAFVAASMFANLISNVVSLWYLATFAAAAVGVVLRGQRRLAEAADGATAELATTAVS